MSVTRVMAHAPVEGQPFKSTSWHWRIELSPLGRYLTGRDGKPLEFHDREEADRRLAAECGEVA